MHLRLDRQWVLGDEFVALAERSYRRFFGDFSRIADSTNQSVYRQYQIRLIDIDKSALRWPISLISSCTFVCSVSPGPSGPS